eukprot:1145466-Amphidinium_carterae.2
MLSNATKPTAVTKLRKYLGNELFGTAVKRWNECLSVQEVEIEICGKQFFLLGDIQGRDWYEKSPLLKDTTCNWRSDCTIP